MKKEITEFTDYFTFSNLASYSGIKHFVSTNINKSGKEELDISFNTGKAPDIIIKNRKLLSQATGIPLESFVMQNQIHSDNITQIDESHKGFGIHNHDQTIPDSDAMISNKKGLCLFLFAADCVPILIYDPKLNIIAAVHSGWKGSVKKIAQKTVIEMNKVFNSAPEDIIVGIGPSISLKNYEVGDNVVNAVIDSFGTKENYLQLNNTTGKYQFDLKYTVTKQLTDVGIKTENIETSDFCTYEKSDLFFSARKNINAGRFSAGIMLL